MSSKSNGFSFIEVSIVLVIVSILAALAYPGYMRHLVTMRRVEAASTLSRLALAMERYYIENGTYQHATLADLHFPVMIAEGNYILGIESAAAGDYLLTARPLANDPECGTLAVDGRGERKISGTGKLEDCW